MREQTDWLIDDGSKHFRDFANGPKNWTQGDNESLRIKK
jgi:hypothetical protein